MRSAKRRQKRGKLLYEGLIVGAFMTIVIVQSLNDKIGIPTASALPAASTLMRANFPVCASAKRHTCIVDGDTVWLKGEKMRLSGINAPEAGNPKCRREAELAEKATRRLLSRSVRPNSMGNRAPTIRPLREALARMG